MSAALVRVELYPAAWVHFANSSFTFHRVALPAPTITLRQPAPTTRKSA
ncbi:MAG: hypothetical protein NTX28_00215 [Novosphingobium sp.]|nr:hypothetical protein [Novosphingobium sp.]